MVYRDFENIKKTYDVLDGVVLLLSLWSYDKHASYHCIIGTRRTTNA